MSGQTAARPGPSRITAEELSRYLTSLLDAPAQVVAVAPLGEPARPDSLKAYGYGTPLLIESRVAGVARRFVLETVSPDGPGHEGVEDRAQVLLWDYRTFNHLPRHARALDVGGITPVGLVSLAAVEEPFLLMEFVEGHGYFEDLVSLRDGRELAEQDEARADALCDYLVRIHRIAKTSPRLYVRRIRELLGHGECIMGVIDAYPPDHPSAPPGLLQEIETRCVAWRWRLKRRVHRLRQVHGDFHPWNLLFRRGVDFSVLDRARGEWGDPADDVASLTMNYLFFSLQRSRRLDGALGSLFERFWRRYLAASGDRELLEVIAPFLAFRGLVMASPVWYPNLDPAVRHGLLAFVRNVLDVDAFDPVEAGGLCAS